MNSIIDAQNDYLYCRGVEYADILSGNLPMTPATAMDLKLRSEDQTLPLRTVKLLSVRGVSLNRSGKLYIYPDSSSILNSPTV